MPTFNKGIFENIEFTTFPKEKHRILSSIFGWYRPYAPGQIVNFKLKINSTNKEQGGFELFRRHKDKEFFIANHYFDKSKRVLNIDGISLPGEGTLEYFLRPSFSDKEQVLVSVVASHNDQITMLILTAIVGGIISLGVAIILTLFKIEPLINITELLSG